MNRTVPALFLIVLTALPVYARNCFTEHLSEAITLNNIRKPLYSALSGGQSEEISNLLIWNERLVLPIAFGIDLLAGRLQREGYPVICEDFLPMVSVSAFQSHRPVPAGIHFQILPYQEIRNRLKQLLNANSGLTQFQVVDSELKKILEGTEYPYFNCMGIHLLRAVQHSCGNAIRFIQIAERRQNRSQAQRLEKFYRFFIGAQLKALTAVTEIDQKAAALQRQGLPIICNDVP